MPSIKLISEVSAWRNFTLKEETSDRIVFELWDKTNWDKIAKGVNRESLLGNLTTIILLLGASLLFFVIVPKPWGTIVFVVRRQNI